jgi:hypothetical protein
MISKKRHDIQVYDTKEGRIYTRSGGHMISPAYLANPSVRWDTQHQKYAFYNSNKVRVGATPSFEQAMDWLLEGYSP